MKFDFASQIPIYQQVADQIEAGILQGSFVECTQIPSTTEISRAFKINPATVLKGMNVLVSQGIIEKRRGVGMFVLAGSKEKVHQKRKQQFLETEVKELIIEAKKLAITKADLLSLLEEEFIDGK